MARGRGRRRKFKDLVEEGQVLRLSPEGHGHVEAERRPVLVPGALPGEEVSFQRRSRKGPVDMGELVQSSNDAEDRVEARCPHFGDCGGCTLQHLSHAAQLRHSQSVLKQLLTDANCPDDYEELPPLVAESTWNYRRRARLGVRWVEKKGRVLVGFRERRDPRFVADISECHVLDARAAETLPVLSTLIQGLSIRSELPQVEVAMGDDGGIFVFRVLAAPSESDRAALAEFEASTGISVYLQPAGLDSVAPLAAFADSGEAAPSAAQPAELVQRLPEFEVAFRYGPTDFVQVNAGINQLMVQRVLELLELKPQDRVLDLFCGLGNFTLPLARRVDQVWGIEGDAQLVARAEANARELGLENVRFTTRDLYKTSGDDTQIPAFDLGSDIDLVLLDPPRSGALPTLSRIAELQPRRIAYVACGPESLARDVSLLCSEYGFKLSKAGIIDMFPHTGHFESVVILDRAPADA